MVRNATLRSFGCSLCGCAVAVAWSAASLWACVNEYEPKPQRVDPDQQRYWEERVNANDYLAAMTRGADEHRVSDEDLARHAAAAAQGDFRDRSDYAVALMRRGKAAQAVELLEQVEADHPGEYIVAANLGTAYELTGNNSAALHWIRTGVERNPQAHQGTEWLHVKILESKLNLAANPRWLAQHSVLGLDFGSNERPATPPQTVADQFGIRKTLAEVRAALEYQLHERLAFVAAPDAIVADLLLDLGNLLALGNLPHMAEQVYGLAGQYDPTRSLLIYKRHAYLEQIGLHRMSWGLPFSQMESVAAIGAIAFIVLGMVLHLRRAHSAPKTQIMTGDRSANSATKPAPNTG